VSTTIEASQRYARALGFRAGMVAFLADLGERRGWKLAAGILAGQFAGALTRFLDSPTQANLDALLGLDGAMARMQSRLPGVRPGFRADR
jgi:hypothetical protein